jgi:hypothetical protein
MSFEAGYGETHDCQPPQIRLGWSLISDVASVEIGNIAVRFGDLLVTGLQ